MTLTEIPAPTTTLPCWSPWEITDDGQLALGVREYIAAHLSDEFRDYVFNCICMNEGVSYLEVCNVLEATGISLILALKGLRDLDDREGYATYLNPEQWPDYIALISNQPMPGWFNKWRGSHA